MIASLTKLSSLLLGVALLLTGHGLQLALVPLRSQLMGWSAGQIGLLSSVYFLGFIVGCYSVPRIVARTGHIRTFAALSMVMTASILTLPILDVLPAWMLLRMFTGIAIAGLYLVIESWLNEQADRDVRGSVLAAYTVIVLVGLALGQLLLNAASLEGDRLFMLSAILIVLAGLPVCMTGSGHPKPIPQASFSPLLVLRTSRTASLGSAVSGMVSGTVYGLGPVYGIQIGLEVLAISFMMSLVITGGALSQLPLGRMSDRMDRRVILLICMVSGSVISIVALLLPISLVPAVMFLFGASVLPLYAISLALANDHAEDGKFLEIGTGLLMINAIGSIFGPLLASQLMERLGPEYFFVFQLVVLFLGAVLVLVMIRTRAAAPEHTGEFEIATTASAQAAFQMDPRTDEEPDEEPGEDTAETDPDVDVDKP